MGDVSEAKAIERLFEADLAKVSVSATKSMTGHLMGAAGAVESIICVLSIRDNVVPPTINTTSLDREVSRKIRFVLGQSEEHPVNIAMSNTFGFGGHNAIVVLRRFSA